MSRIRSIKPELQQLETLGRVCRDARLTFLLLHPQCDDAGIARASSRMLASLLYPYDDDAPSLIDGWLSELEREKLIVRYEVAGAAYLSICNWADFQKIDRPSKSKFPPPPNEDGEASRILATDRESSVLDQGKDQEGISLSGAHASESEGSQDADHWPAFRAVIVETWPGGFPMGDVGPARIEFERITREHAAETLIACARSHGTAETARKAKNGNIPGGFRTKSPSSWLRQRGWEGYVAEAQVAALHDVEQSRNLASVRETLSQDVFERLKRCGLPDNKLAKCSGLTFEGPATFFAETTFQASLLRDLPRARLEHEFGEAFEIIEPGQRRAA